MMFFKLPTIGQNSLGTMLIQFTIRPYGMVHTVWTIPYKPYTTIYKDKHVKKLRPCTKILVLAISIPDKLGIIGYGPWECKLRVVHNLSLLLRKTNLNFHQSYEHHELSLKLADDLTNGCRSILDCLNIHIRVFSELFLL